MQELKNIIILINKKIFRIVILYWLHLTFGAWKRWAFDRRMCQTAKILKFVVVVKLQRPPIFFQTCVSHSVVFCYRRIDIYVNEMQDNKYVPHYQRAFCIYYESQTRVGFECQEKIL